MSVKVICIGLGELVGLLEKLSDDTTMTHDARSEAQILLAAILKLEFFVLLYLWNTCNSWITRSCSEEVAGSKHGCCS